MADEPIQGSDAPGNANGTPTPPTPSADRRAQVAEERAELVNAPLVQLGPPLGRCHFCGRLARTFTLVEVVNGQERLRGECCGST